MPTFDPRNNWRQAQQTNFYQKRRVAPSALFNQGGQQPYGTARNQMMDQMFGGGGQQGIRAPDIPRGGPLPRRDDPYPREQARRDWWKMMQEQRSGGGGWKFDQNGRPLPNQNYPRPGYEFPRPQGPRGPIY